MRILWVKVGGLWPLNSGGRLRSFHILSELSRGHRLTLLTTHGPGENPEVLARHLPQVAEILSVPYEIAKRTSARFLLALVRSWFSPLPVDLWKFRVPPLSREVERKMGNGEIDVCVADFLSATPNVPLGGRAPVVLFAHNVEHMIWKRLSDVERHPWRRLFIEIEWRKMRRCEARACRQSALTIAVSEADRDLLSAIAPGARIAAVPTGVDTAYFTPNGTREAPMSLVFTGSMGWYPNEDAILYFIDTVLPQIRQEIPEVAFTVVGQNPSHRLVEHAKETGVRVAGTVEDIRPYVAEASVYVVPLRIGGGTRLKIFEALAMGKAVVSTRVGAEGLPLIPGEHFIRADDPSDFAGAVVSLLRDPGRRKVLGLAGRRLVEERYAWRQVAEEFESRCFEALDFSKGGIPW